MLIPSMHKGDQRTLVLEPLSCHRLRVTSELLELTEIAGIVSCSLGREGGPMDKAILLAVVASFCTATASVAQRQGASNVHTTGGFDIRLIFRLARRPIWLLGIVSMIGGFLFQLAALRFGAVALVQPILAFELLLVFGYMAIAGRRRVKIKRRDWLAAGAMSAGIAGFLRLASPSGGRLHAPGPSWLLAASQPGFTILDPLSAALLGVFLFGEHIQTGAWNLAGEALALALVIAGAAGISHSCFILGEVGDPSCLPAGFQARAHSKQFPKLTPGYQAVGASEERASSNQQPHTSANPSSP